MNTLEHVRDGLERAWDYLSEGWRQLRERAAHAITHFNPIQRTHDGESRDVELERSASRWGLLAAEVSEDPDHVAVKLEVPGMNPDDFDIQIVNNHLLVRGEKRLQRDHNDGRYVVMERAYGAFERAVPLPTEVDENKAVARYRRGVLNVTLPKSRSSASRRIKVETG